jgi:ribosomal protein L7/L12
MADIQQLEDQIVSLSLLEASALVKKLEERLGVPLRHRRRAELRQRPRLRRRPSSP